MDGLSLLDARSDLYRVIVAEFDPPSDVAAIKLCDAIERLIEAKMEPYNRTPSLPK